MEIPDSVENIGIFAIGCDDYLTRLTIGKNVKNIGSSSIGAGCERLKTVKILIEDYENCEISSDCFGEKDGVDTDWLSAGSTIYVLNEGMKNKLAGTYDPAKTEVKVVTLEEMNAI